MSRLFHLLENTIRLYFDYLIHRRSPGMRLITVGAGLIALILGGIAFDLSFPTSTGVVKIGFNTQAGVGYVLTVGVLALGVLLIVFGAYRLCREFAAADRLRVIVIELRGLRDWNGSPLVEAVPSRLRGKRESVVLDLRQRVEDGVIVSPSSALSGLQALRPRLNAIESGLDRRDIKHVLGGLAPVPFTFLLGVLVDDESPITIMDWDRHLRRWRELSDADDGQRFSVEGMDIAGGNESVILAISASYSVDIGGARSKVGPMPVVQMVLSGASTDAHWSAEKQQALARQFLDVAVRLGNAGVRTIHLFFAGPSSLVLRFGMTYDKRNLPNVVAYQYERGETPPFPWGVSMPVAGQTTAKIVV